jgi:hypothetical protein
MPSRDNPAWGDPRFVDSLLAFAHGRETETSVLPWVNRLSSHDQERLRRDLALVLSEPAETGEPLDWQEIATLLREWAEAAGETVELVQLDSLRVKKGPPAGAAFAPRRVFDPPEGLYSIDLPARDTEALATASAAVQTAFYTLVTRFLAHHPTAGHLLPYGRLKKLENRGSWQVEMPDGYRLRYVVDKLERTVYVTYLGPHPDRDTRGREQSARSRIWRYRNDQN